MTFVQTERTNIISEATHHRVLFLLFNELYTQMLLNAQIRDTTTVIIDSVYIFAKLVKIKFSELWQRINFGRYHYVDMSLNKKKRRSTIRPSDVSLEALITANIVRIMYKHSACSYICLVKVG